MKRFLLLLFICILSISQAQLEKQFFDDFNFIRHLSANRLFTEAESEKEKLFTGPGISQLYRDSVNYSLALAYRDAGRKSEARKNFVLISDEPFFYYRARYLAAMIDAEADRPDSAAAILEQISESTNPDLNELKNYELAALTLYKGHSSKFDSVASNLRFSNPLLDEEMIRLKGLSVDQKKIKRRSPFLAGTLSAIIPGLGKVYAGNNGQALASFLTCGLMAAVAGENYINLGLTHPQTIFFTGLFGIFYIGNIWGSALSVQIVKTEKQLENKHNILVGIQLPVSRFFN